MKFIGVVFPTAYDKLVGAMRVELAILYAVETDGAFVRRTREISSNQFLPGGRYLGQVNSMTVA